MKLTDRILIGFAGLLGATGVAAAAIASHADTRVLGSYALIALTHAPALLALALVPKSKWLEGSAIILLAGSALFCGDLAARHFLGHGLFPLAAPAGGFVLMLGWLGLTVTAMFSRAG